MKLKIQQCEERTSSGDRTAGLSLDHAKVSGLCQLEGTLKSLTSPEPRTLQQPCTSDSTIPPM